MSMYLLGLATLPALALLVVLVILAFHGPRIDGYGCPRGSCDYECDAWRFEPWWAFDIRRKRTFRRHLASGIECRLYMEKRIARMARR